jgi:hypothetical protein
MNPPLLSDRVDSSEDEILSSLKPEFNFEQYEIGAQNLNPTTSQSIEQLNIEAVDDGLIGVKPANTWIEKAKTEIMQILKQTNEKYDKAINPFPVEVYPQAMQQIITATNESLNFPVDFIGASMLYAACVAIGNTFRVEVKTGWQESAVLYLALVGRPGTNKTHPLQFALRPILEHDNGTYQEYEKQKKEYDRAAKATKKDNGQVEDDEPEKPVLKQILLRDTTPEALALAHKYNKRGIGVYSDELAGWFKNFNRYNKGSEMEFWLSAWSSTAISINRKTSEPIYISMPFISVAGTIQNGILNELAKDNRAENGFIDRILFVMPDNLQKPYWNDTELKQAFIHNWEGIISNLLSVELPIDNTLSPTPDILRLTEEAKGVFSAWQRINTDECNAAENEAISGIYSKLELYVIRLALILELLAWACNEGNRQEVGLKAMQGAVKLVEYFKVSAVKVYSIISNANPVELLTADKKKLYAILPDTFSTEQGLQVAVNLDIAERTYKRFIADGKYFKHLTRGEYEKLF